MQLLGILSHSDTAERLKLPGMPAERVDVVLPGTLVLAEVMKLFGASSVLVNARGIREGIVIDTLASEGAIAHKADHLQAVRDLGARYRYDRAARRAGHAARALALRSACASRCGSIPTAAPLLQTAAMLHDIGYYVAYDRHHKHSYHLILHAIPAAVHAPRDVHGRVDRPLPHQVAAQARARVVGVARPAGPARRSASLAAILRIADGLDRGRGGPCRPRRSRR